jgi:IclR family mhp operon transcriptional activator
MSRPLHRLDRRPAASPRPAPPRAAEAIPRTANGRRVRGLTRGLAILRALNENNYATALQLSRITGLPRPTVYRLLDTLIAAGYVAHGTRPTSTASPSPCALAQRRLQRRDLGAVDRAAGHGGAAEGDRLAHGHRELLRRRDGGARSDPRLRRSRSIAKAGSVPVLLTSLGLVYLANLGEAGDTILRDRGVRPARAALARDRRAVGALLAVRRRVRLPRGGISPDRLHRRAGDVARPPIACISLRYILSAMAMEQVAERYLAPMRAAATRIEKRWSSGAAPGRSGEEAPRA